MHTLNGGTNVGCSLGRSVSGICITRIEAHFGALGLSAVLVNGYGNHFICKVIPM